MSNNPLLNSADQSSKTPGLKPPLAAALASLEVQLDQELARYRRTRIGSRVPNQPSLYSSMTAQTQDSTHMNTSERNTQIPTITPPPTISQSQEVSVPKMAAEPEVTGLEVPTVKDTPQDTNSHQIVPAVSQDDNLAPDTNNFGKPPDDYLESSEALLRSLTEEQASTQEQKASKNSDFLLSPLGIGLMLLLIVGSLALGYGFSNPKSLPQLSLTKLFKRNSPVVEKTETTGSKAKTVSQPEITPVPKYPNLATQEFPEVKDLNDVVGLEPKPKLTPTTTPAPAVTPNPPNPSTSTTAIVTPSTAPKPAIPQTTTAKPKPTPAQPEAEIKPSADGFYYVVADNQSPELFAKAKKEVPDAYLSPSKKYIYLGATKDKVKAQTLIKKLQAQGIKARTGNP